MKQSKKKEAYSLSQIHVGPYNKRIPEQCQTIEYCPNGN
jgi:hypothetical protein